MNAPDLRPLQSHDESRERELNEALSEVANRRSGPGPYEPPMYEFEASCFCSARLGRDRYWTWDATDCVLREEVTL